MQKSIIQGRLEIIIENICLNANVLLISWALFDADGLPLYSNFKTDEEEFGAMAAIILGVFKRIPILAGCCYYFPKRDIFLYRIKIDTKYFILTIAIEKNIKNRTLVEMNIRKYEKRIIEILSEKLDI
ncbi:MAG: hypothetical protein ACTSYB_10035 [Candidatus Helarchaeota archaeon]